jgi:hypothetical protein
MAKLSMMLVFRVSGIGRDSTPLGVHRDAIEAVHRNYKHLELTFNISFGVKRYLE